jgi:hypothetical protein
MSLLKINPVLNDQQQDSIFKRFPFHVYNIDRVKVFCNIVAIFLIPLSFMKFNVNWDAVGIGTSIACAIHCALLPLILYQSAIVWNDCD